MQISQNRRSFRALWSLNQIEMHSSRESLGSDFQTNRPKPSYGIIGFRGTTESPVCDECNGNCLFSNKIETHMMAV